MANVVYNKFISDVVSSNIDLELSDTYKVALLKGYPGDNGPDADDEYTFDTLQLAGYECVDTGEYADEEDCGYKSGGLFVQLSKLDGVYAINGTVEYTSTDPRWNHVTLNEDNSAKYALLYRYTDGLLVSCYTLDSPIEVDDKTVALTWFNVPVLSFTITDVTQGEGVIVEDEFSLISNNALKNRVITGGINNFGVAIGGEDIPEVFENMDILTPITEDFVDSLFKE